MVFVIYEKFGFEKFFPHWRTYPNKRSPKFSDSNNFPSNNFEEPNKFFFNFKVIIFYQELSLVLMVKIFFKNIEFKKRKFRLELHGS